MRQDNGKSPPRLVIPEAYETLTTLLLAGQRLLVKYPQAAKALLEAFVSEGRAFAQTPEGQEWRDRLAHSRLASQGRFIWDAYNLDGLLENESDQLPSAWLDVIVAAVSNDELESILSSLVVEEVKHGTFGPV